MDNTKNTASRVKIPCGLEGYRMEAHGSEDCALLDTEGGQWSVATIESAPEHADFKDEAPWSSLAMAEYLAALHNQNIALAHSPVNTAQPAGSERPLDIQNCLDDLRDFAGTEANPSWVVPLVNEVEAYISTLEGLRSQGAWVPIESAPRDGSVVDAARLLENGDYVEFRCWWTADGRWAKEGTLNVGMNPTHYRAALTQPVSAPSLTAEELQEAIDALVACSATLRRARDWHDAAALPYATTFPRVAMDIEAADIVVAKLRAAQSQPAQPAKGVE